MSDDTTEDPAPHPVLTFRHVPVGVCYALTCPDVGNLREALTFAIEIGMQAESIDANTYRLTGDLALAEKVRWWIVFYQPAGPVVIDAEQPPETPSVSFRVASRAPGVRSAIIHAGTDYARLVALAVDSGLSVVCVGIRRYEVTGTTRDHLKWTAAFLNVSHTQALERLHLTQAQADAEDAGPPPIRVELPRRETTSKIDRDRDGFIRTIEQLERSV